MEGAPAGHDPVAAEIGYRAPHRYLVFYYDSDAPYFDGILRIGRVDGDMSAIAHQAGNFSATIERVRVESLRCQCPLSSPPSTTCMRST